MNKGIEVFFSYAHASEDEDLLDELIKHLSEWKRQGLISPWHDRDVRAGIEWLHTIDTHLNTAQIILLLISPDFIASDYCNSIEVAQAMKRHVLGEARVIPIILPVFGIASNIHDVTRGNASGCSKEIIAVMPGLKESQYSQEGKATMHVETRFSGGGTITIRSLSPEEVDPEAYQFLVLFTTSELGNTDHNRSAFVVDYGAE